MLLENENRSLIEIIDKCHKGVYGETQKLEEQKD